MKRRSVVIGLGSIGLAGCLGGIGDEPSPTPTGDPEFAVTDRSCGNGQNAASVSFNTDSVTVAGTIGGRDTCDTALLDGVEWSDDTLTIRVKVAREKATETVACAECLTDIDYTATVPTGDRSLSTVKVIHVTSSGPQTVTTASP